MSEIPKRIWFCGDFDEYGIGQRVVVFNRKPTIDGIPPPIDLYISADALRELVDGMSKEAAIQGSGDGLFRVLVSELRKLLEGA